MKRRLPPKLTLQWPALTTVAWILCGLALLSMFILDFINRQKGEKSFIFARPVPKKESTRPPLSLSDLVLESLTSAGIPSHEIGRKSGAQEGFACRLDAGLGRYQELAPLVEKEFNVRAISIVDRKTSEGKEIVESLWLLKRGEEKSDVTFSWPAEREKAAEKTAESLPLTRGLVALVVDDMGNSLEALDDLISLKNPVTVSILPYSAYARETARIAHDKGLEVMLHLPLESLNGNGSETWTEGLIQSGMSETEILRLMAEDLDQVPYIKGVNNHMGSKVTAERDLMRIILEPIKERGLFFLDSRTSGRSVAYDTARSMGVPSAYRQVFLDADGNGSLIKDRISELFRLARKNGRAIGICHPFRETLQALKENFHLLKNYGLEAVAASKLMNKQGRPSAVLN